MPAPERSARRSRPAWRWVLLAFGLLALAAAVALDAPDVGPAAGQDWPPFVLVGGLLLIGMVAAEEGLFEASGRKVAGVARRPAVLYVSAVVTVGLVTALLNLDTSVVFLTPVLVHAARSRNFDEEPVLYASVLCANAGSLFLPGSNLTNLIVLGPLRLTGAQFFAHMWVAALGALLITATITGLSTRRARSPIQAEPREGAPWRPGLGTVAAVASAVAVVWLRNPALPVVALGAVAVAIRLWQRRFSPSAVLAVLDLRVLAGLFSAAVALGTLGRTWSGPAQMLGHLDRWGTAASAAAGAVLVNNLPAASLLASRPSGHPFALLVGLNLGPNLFVSGSLAWVLWTKAAASAGARPSLRRAVKVGALSVPPSMAFAILVLGSGR